MPISRSPTPEDEALKQQEQMAEQQRQIEQQQQQIESQRQLIEQQRQQNLQQQRDASIPSVHQGLPGGGAIGPAPPSNYFPSGMQFLTSLDQSDAQIMALSPLKLPDFWNEQPELWFIHIEAQFTTRNIKSDNSRYGAVVAALKPEILQEVSDILRTPPVTDKYEYLKQQLIKRLTDSVDRRLHKLLTELELGFQKPSQLLRRMRDQAGARASEEILRSVWLSRLPDIVTKILKAVQGGSTLDQLAEAADSAMENNTGAHVMATDPHRSAFNVQTSAPLAVSTQSSRSNVSLEQRVSSIEKSIETLSATLQQLSTKVGQFNARRSRSRSLSRPSTPGPLGPSGFCFYHERFGARALRCQPGCTHPNAYQLQQQQQGN